MGTIILMPIILMGAYQYQYHCVHVCAHERKKEEPVQISFQISQISHV